MFSTERALNIPEILELILLSLPESTLLTTAQLVSKQWHGHIASSPRIQQTLFFAPCPRPIPHRLNPLLTTHFPIFFDEKQHLLEDFKELSFGSHSFNMDWNMREDAQAPGIYALREKFLSPSASWRRMLPSQPPPVVLPYSVYTKSSGRWSEGQLDFKRPGHYKPPGFKARHGQGPIIDTTNVDERSSCTWTMGHLYDIATYGTWRIVWDVQAHMLCEAVNKQPYDSGADGNEYPLKVNARISKPMVRVDSGDGGKTLRVPLSDALKGHDVYFQAVHHSACGRWGWSWAFASDMRRYYKFPAADLDAPSSSSDEESDEDDDDASEEEDSA